MKLDRWKNEVILHMNLKMISRQPSNSTGTGYRKVHLQEQAEVIETAFSI